MELVEIQRAASRSAELTGQLLAFARKQTVAPKRLDMNSAVQGMLHMLHRLLGEQIELNWRPGEEVWPVLMDPAQLDQVVTNLCVNARDAIADVGTIVLETQNVYLDEDYCEAFPECAPGAYVMLAVSDSGCGMDAETLANVFEPFYTTKPLGQGSGLGLSTVYGIAKQNNGGVTVYSEPGRGTTFKLYLPPHPEKAADAAAVHPPTIPRAQGETVLFVEDEESILTLGKRTLTGLGYTVIAASAPGEALRLAEARANSIHLLITDVIMPEMNGRELAEQLSNLQPKVKVLFISGYTADVIAHHGVLDQAVHFLQKPFTRADLATAVRAALEE